MKKILIHMCCAPCSCYPVKKLRDENLEPVGYFFNPNIHPYLEWDRRLKTVKEFSEKVDLEIHCDEHYLLKEFLNRALEVEPESRPPFEKFHPRCKFCYEWRLEQTAKFAAENNFELFTSTLFYSIYQQHDLMKEICERLSKIYGVEFFYEDFRIGWQEGIDISKELELYRQPYCGCIFSEEERFSRELRKQRKKFAKLKKSI